MALHELPPHPIPLPLRWGTAIELRRNGFFPILIVILLLISKNLSRSRLRLGLRLRACQCGPAAELNSMAVHPCPSPHPTVAFRPGRGIRASHQLGGGAELRAVVRGVDFSN